MTADEFNATYPVGTPVHYHPVIGRPDAIKTRTRFPAWTLYSGEPVVKVEGVAGCVSLRALSRQGEGGE